MSISQGRDRTIAVEINLRYVLPSIMYLVLRIANRGED